MEKTVFKINTILGGEGREFLSTIRTNQESTRELLVNFEACCNCHAPLLQAEDSCDACKPLKLLGLRLMLQNGASVRLEGGSNSETVFASQGT